MKEHLFSSNINNYSSDNIVIYHQVFFDGYQIIINSSSDNQYHISSYTSSTKRYLVGHQHFFLEHQRIWSDIDISSWNIKIFGRSSTFLPRTSTYLVRHQHLFVEHQGIWSDMDISSSDIKIFGWISTFLPRISMYLVGHGYFFIEYQRIWSDIDIFRGTSMYLVDFFVEHQGIWSDMDISSSNIKIFGQI